MEKEKTKKRINFNLKKISKLAIFLYFIAILFLGYTGFTIYNSYNYISELVAYGSIDMSSQMMDVVNYYITASAPYAFYAIVAWVLGFIVNKVKFFTDYINTLNNHVIDDAQ